MLRYFLWWLKEFWWESWDSTNTPCSDGMVGESIRKSCPKSTPELMLFIFFKIDIFVAMFSGCENHEALASAIVSQCCTNLIGTIFTTTRKWVSKNKIRTRKISDEYEQIVPPFYMIVTNMSEFMSDTILSVLKSLFLRQSSIRSEYTAAKSRYSGTHVAYALMVPFPLIKK